MEITPPEISPRDRRAMAWLTALIVLAGIALRSIAWEDVPRHYFDEAYYLRYAKFHATEPLAHFDEFCAKFTEHQRDASVGIPPPTRLLYPLAGATIHGLTGWEMPRSLTFVSACASALLLVVAALWSWRMFTPGLAATVAALVAVSLNQLHLSQRIMIDPVLGIFCLTAIWSLWEIGARREYPRLFTTLYLFAMAAIITVKENSFFIYVGVAVLIVLGRRTKILPDLPRWVLPATVLTGALSFTLLVQLAGGFEAFFEMYRLLVARSLVTPYTIAFGDGPWHRYLIDSIMAQPIPTVLALAALFWAPWENARLRYLTFFLLITYVLMAQVKYGMYYRYGIIWDLPIAALAAFQLRKLVGTWVPGRRAALVQALLVAGICAVQFNNYWRIAVRSDSYALTSFDMFTALKMYNSDALKQEPPPPSR